MLREKGLPTARVPLWAVVVAGLAVAVSFAAVTMLFDVADALPGEILTALLSVDRGAPDGGLMIIHCGPPTGVARGIQMGLLTLLLGGIPAAILAMGLAAVRRTGQRGWSGNWEHVFFAGFIFQFSSLAFSALLIALLLLVAYPAEAAAHKVEMLIHIGFLLSSVLCGMWGLRSWRVLQHGVRQTPLTISTRERGSA